MIYGTLSRRPSESIPLTEVEISRIKMSRAAGPLDRMRIPTTCRSANHSIGDCYGYVRKCPLCRTRVCWQDGSDDILDELIPGICDTCASLIMEANPEQFR